MCFPRWLNVALILILNSIQPTTTTYTFTLETALRTELYTTNNYDKISRPDGTTNMTVHFMPISLNSLSIKDQTMSITGYYTFQWTDGRLDWSANPTYSSINYIFSTSDVTWRPTLIIVNSVSDTSILNDEYNMMRVDNTGSVMWSEMLELETSCDCDITFYPFDTQKCSIIVTTWSYTEDEVAISFFQNPVIMDFFSENGEWEYISYSINIYNEYRTTLPYNMAQIEFTFRRRPQFMVMNTILPVILVAMLSCFVFKVPAEQGKIGYCLTVMLAYAVYLTLVSDNMPSTSIQTSILSVYNIFVLTMDVLSVLITLFILGCYQEEDDTPVPQWLTKAVYISSKILGCPCQRSKKISSSVIKIDVKEEHTDKKEETTLSWKEISMILDKVFFRIYLVTVVVITVLLMISLLIGYGTMFNTLS